MLNQFWQKEKFFSDLNLKKVKKPFKKNLLTSCPTFLNVVRIIQTKFAIFQNDISPFI